MILVFLVSGVLLIDMGYVMEMKSVNHIEVGQI